MSGYNYNQFGTTNWRFQQDLWKHGLFRKCENQWNCSSVKVNNENSHVTCSKDVGVEDQALVCDLCEKWEHMECIQLSDRPTEALYAESVRCRTRPLIFLCTKCQTKGPSLKDW